MLPSDPQRLEKLVQGCVKDNIIICSLFVQHNRFVHLGKIIRASFYMFQSRPKGLFSKNIYIFFFRKMEIINFLSKAILPQRQSILKIILKKSWSGHQCASSLKGKMKDDVTPMYNTLPLPLSHAIMLSELFWLIMFVCVKGQWMD